MIVKKDEILCGAGSLCCDKCISATVGGSSCSARARVHLFIFVFQEVDPK